MGTVVVVVGEEHSNLLVMNVWPARLLVYTGSLY